MTTTEHALRPCPFCGFRAVEDDEGVHCSMSMCGGSDLCMGRDEWNNRRAPTPVEAGKLTEEERKARMAVKEHRDKLYPVGKDRAALCHAAVVLDGAIERLLSTPASEVEAAVKVLIAALNDDPGYRQGWQANIAVQFVDEMKRDADNIHEAANRAADNFLRLLTAPRPEAATKERAHSQDCAITLNARHGCSCAGKETP